MHPEEPAGGSASVVLTAALDVVCASRRWRVLHAPLGDVANLADAVLLAPAAAWFYVDRRLVEVAVVAQLRQGCDRAWPAPGASPGRVRAVVEALCARSDRFRALWAGAPVRPRLRTPYEVRHPALGRLSLVRRVTPAPGGRWHEEVAPTGTDAPLLGLLDLL